MSRNSGSSFSATATASGNYKFVGWYDNADCTGTAVSTNATLSVTLTEDKIYYAKFVEQSSVTITFDASNTTWVSNASACMWVYDTSSGNKYKMTNSSNKWTASVPVSVTNITFYRCTPAGFGTTKVESESTAGYWNIWSAGERNKKTTYKTNADNTTGSWQ